MTQLSRVIYVSHPRVPVQSVILDIVRSAEFNNARLGASGMLIYSDFAYCQVLEGSAQSINALLRDIGADDRHSIAEMVIHQTDQRRIPSTLSMGYAAAQLLEPMTGHLHQHAEAALHYVCELAYSLYPKSTGSYSASVTISSAATKHPSSPSSPNASAA